MIGWHFAAEKLRDGRPLADGLYRVHADRICAGFVIADGRVVVCAPILRRNLDRWARVATRITADAPLLAEASDG